MEGESKQLKRSMDGTDGPTRKKVKEAEGDDRVAFKILIPQIAVGAIIGKGGESMRALKHEFHCAVSMSKTGEMYPGTNERICLIKGTINNAVNVLRSMQEKVHEKCREGQADVDLLDFKNTNRGSEMKIVMPNTSAGMVIGKAGANIKEIRDTYDVNIQVYPKAGTQEARNSLERVIVVANDDLDMLLQAADVILCKVASDPHHAKNLDMEKEASQMGNRAPSPHTQGGYMMPPSGPQIGGYGYQQSSFNPPMQNPGPQFNPPNNIELHRFLDQLQCTLRDAGFSNESINEVNQALNVLAKYNIMGLGLGFGCVPLASNRQNPNMMQTMPNIPGFGGGMGFGMGQNYQWNG